MSSNYRFDDVDLNNKFAMIAHPMQISYNDESEDEDEESANYHWLAKSRRLQARRWRAIKRQEV